MYDCGLGRIMREKILKEALEWYESQDSNPNIEDFVDIIIGKTTETVLDHVQNELEQEFRSGVLKHPFFISSEYYLELKLKDVKNKYLLEEKEDEEINEETS